MSAEGVQVLRDMFAALARGDLAAVMAGLDESIEWNTPEALPFGGTHRGHSGVGALLGELRKSFRELHVEPLEFIDGGDTIVVLVRSRATGAAGSCDQTIAMLWRMKDGKAVSFTEFLDTALVLGVLGYEITPPA